MNKKFAARIYWLSREQGGRQEPPVGDKYAPIIKITNPLIESDEFWSVFVTNKNRLNENETLAEMEYLSDKAPNNLYKDVEFELFEGNKLVAKGTILYNSMAI